MSDGRKVNLRYISRFKGILLLFLMIIFFLTCIIFIPKVFAAPQPVKSIDLFSEKTNYKNSEAGAWKVTKSAKWISRDTAEVRFDVDTVTSKSKDNMDILFVLDVSESMVNERLDRVKKDTIGLVNKLFDLGDNKVSVIKFNHISDVLLDFSNDKDKVIESINSLTVDGGTSYYQALVSVDKVLKNYVKESGRECMVLFLTDGCANYDTPNEVGEYKYLKKQYPYLTISGIQYEMGEFLYPAIENISDYQFIANMKNLENVLFDAALSLNTYDYFEINDFISENFYIEDEKNIKSDFGNITFDKEKQEINWKLDGFKAGFKATLTFFAKIKNVNSEEIYPTNNSETIKSQLDGKKELIESKKTPVPKRVHSVIYDVNAPSDCSVDAISGSNSYNVFDTVGVSDEVPVCEGYQFKGWKIKNTDIEMINDDYFVMPESDVIIKGTWSRLNITKSMTGEVKETLNLYKQVQLDFKDSSKYVRKYAGDTSTFTGNEDVYYYYGAAKNNNVIFGKYCWKIVRTTDTGGVKLLYSGVPDSNGTCNNTGDDLLLTAAQMNTSSNKISFQEKSADVTEHTPMHVGYMLNKSKLYNWHSKAIGKMNSILTQLTLKENTTNKNYYYYADDYEYKNYFYYLSSPKEIKYGEDKEKLLNKYFCSSLNENARCTTMYYITNVDANYIYGISLATGQSLQDSGKELTFKVSKNVIANGDGTYALTNPEIIQKNMWRNDYLKYKGYYTCGNNQSVCSQINYIYVTSAIYYFSVSNNYNVFKYGNSYTYDNGVYTLSDTVSIWNPYLDDNIYSHHYTCFNDTGVCNKIAYVYDTGSILNTNVVYNYNYIELTNGEGVNDALFNMLSASDLNVDNSLIKTLIDYWYQNNMIKYTKYLEDTVWCNDRSIYDLGGWDPNEGNTYNDLTFHSSISNDLTCKNNLDRFSVDLSNGNGVLDYPVGLLTSQEQRLAFDDSLIVKSPLGSNQSGYWTMSPKNYLGNLAELYVVFKNGNQSYTNSDNSYSQGVRPAISLKSGTEYLTGDGSGDRPYVVVTPVEG